MTRRSLLIAAYSSPPPTSSSVTDGFGTIVPIAAYSSPLPHHFHRPLPASPTASAASARSKRPSPTCSTSARSPAEIIPCSSLLTHRCLQLLLRHRCLQSLPTHRCLLITSTGFLQVCRPDRRRVPARIRAPPRGAHSPPGPGRDRDRGRPVRQLRHPFRHHFRPCFAHCQLRPHPHVPCAVLCFRAHADRVLAHAWNPVL